MSPPPNEFAICPFFRRSVRKSNGVSVLTYWIIVRSSQMANEMKRDPNLLVCPTRLLQEEERNEPVRSNSRLTLTLKNRRGSSKATHGDVAEEPFEQKSMCFVKKMFSSSSSFFLTRITRVECQAFGCPSDAMFGIRTQGSYTSS